MNKIKIYTDISKAKSISKWGYVFPLVELLAKKNQNVLEYYEITDSVEAADFLALPIAVEYLFEKGEKKYFEQYLNLAKSNNKKLIIFTSGDHGKTITDDTVITVRLGGFKNKLPKNTYVMSPFIDDPIEKFNLDFYLLDYQEKPSVGFVGHSAKGVKKWSKEFLIFLKSNLDKIIRKKATDLQAFYPSSIKRYNYLFELKNMTKLNANFIFREKYRGGKLSEEERLKTTLEFYDNIQQSAYTFCLRGAGNFSVRFYETLAMGRIPLLINTDCKLPFDNKINWNRNVIIINKTDINSIVQSIDDFHNKLNDDTFKEIQSENRELWKSFFTKEKYFINFQEELKSLL